MRTNAGEKSGIALLWLKRAGLGIAILTICLVIVWLGSALILFKWRAIEPPEAIRQSSHGALVAGPSPDRRNAGFPSPSESAPLLDDSTTTPTRLLPVRPGLTPAIDLERDALNAIYADLLQTLRECDRDDSGLTFEICQNRLQLALKHQQLHLARVNAQFNLDERSPDPAIRDRAREFMDLYNRLSDELIQAIIRTAVRHGRWQHAAAWSRDFHERVYYYRRMGGFEGYARVAGESFQRGYNGVVGSCFLEDFLPRL